MSAFAKIALLTVLGIFSFTAMILTAIFGLSDRFPTSLLLFTPLSAIVTWWVVKSIIRLNSQHLEGIKERMREPEEFITEWECSEQDWKLFVQEQVTNTRDAKTTTLVVSSFLGIAFLFLIKLQTTWLIAILGGVGAFVIFGGSVYALFRYFNNRRFAKYASRATGTVVLSRKAIQINDHIIDWSMKLYSFGSAHLDESFQCPIMQVTIETKSGDGGTGYATHIVPVPRSKLEEARKIVEYYNEVQ